MRDSGWCGAPNIARSTAFDKLRVAHELARRPVVAEAFREGRLSYSAVRAITRLDQSDPALDQALVTLAQSGQASILDLERVVRSYRLYADQDRPPLDEEDRNRDVKILRSDDGTGQLVVTLRRLELEEFGAALQAFLDIQYRTPAVDESSAEDGAVTGEAPAEEATRSAKKANAFMDLVRTALIHAGDGSAAGDDRYLVHVVSRVNEPGLALLDGTPLHPALAGTLGCDASRVTHTVSESGEPLNLGRKTRNWSTAQRRAITVRDGGHCRFVGCYNTHVDIHHIQPWEDGGEDRHRQWSLRVPASPPDDPPRLSRRRRSQSRTALPPPRWQLPGIDYSCLLPTVGRCLTRAARSRAMPSPGRGELLDNGEGTRSV